MYISLIFPCPCVLGGFSSTALGTCAGLYHVCLWDSQLCRINHLTLITSLAALLFINDDYIFRSIFYIFCALRNHNWIITAVCCSVFSNWWDTDTSVQKGLSWLMYCPAVFSLSLEYFFFLCSLHLVSMEQPCICPSQW